MSTAEQLECRHRPGHDHDTEQRLKGEATFPLIIRLPAPEVVTRREAGRPREDRREDRREDTREAEMAERMW